MTDFTNCRPDIIRAHARALWCCTWADYIDNTGQGLKLSGREITEIALPTKEIYLKEAEENIATIEQNNGASICVLLRKTWEADHSPPLTDAKLAEYVYDFGFSLAMQVLGTGVRWADNHEELPFDVHYRDETEPYGGPIITESDFEEVLKAVAAYDLGEEAGGEHDRRHQVQYSLDPKFKTLAVNEIRRHLKETLFDHSEVKEGLCFVFLDDVYKELDSYGGSSCIPSVGGLPWVRHVLTDKAQEALVRLFADKT